MARMIFLIVFCLGGAAVLISLCIWQVQRLSWKEALIAEIETMAAAAPGSLPDRPEAAADRFRPVEVSGRFGEGALHVLTSQPARGPGYRVIAPFETGGRRVLVDRGFIPQADKAAALDMGPVTLRGNLDWPRETDGFTPDPDLETNIWFARDVAAMAAHLGTEPVLIVASAPTGDPSPVPSPITVRLRNDHLEYAITWGLMAAAWLAMSGYLILRIKRGTD